MENENRPNPDPVIQPAPLSTPVVQPTATSETTLQLSPDNPVTSQAGKQKHHIRRIVIGVVIVLALVVALLVTTASEVNSKTKEAEPVSNAFLQDVIDDDAKAAYSLTNDYFKKTTTETLLDGYAKVIHKNVTKLPAIQMRKVENSTFNGVNTSTVTISYAPSGTEDPINIILQEEAGQWKVAGVHFPSATIKGYTIQ